MAKRLSHLTTAWVLGTMIVAAAPASAATCAEAKQLLSQGFSLAEVAGTIGAPVGFVQTCMQPRMTGVQGGNSLRNAAGPPPFGAAGPAPLGAAGPAPLGAAGPAPHGAAGPAPLGAPGPPPLGAPGR
jgi:hypothetical protein